MLALLSTASRVIMLLLLLLLAPTVALAQQNLAQVPMAGSAIPKWVNPLPLLGPDDLAVVDGANGPLTLNMCEFQAQVLPPPLPATWVWGYVSGPCPASGTIRNTYLGPVVVAERGTPTEVTFVNNLGDAASTNVLAWKYNADQTLHWADPLGLGTGMPGMNWCAMNPPPAGTGPLPAATAPDPNPCALTYAGPIATAPHLHGGEVPPEIDGGPEAWFTSSGIHAGGYYSSVPGLTNSTTFRYPNEQEAGPLWFHDHTLGATRLNVNAGLAGSWLLRDPEQSLPANLPGLDQVIPLILQDRMFDTNGQLFMPGDTADNVLYALNPEHPYWVPEFLGDAIVVNGKAWPFIDVEPKRYRFLVLNGSNARTYDLSLPPGVPMYVIGNDGGYLDAAAPVDNLVIMPGERYELIVDFGRLKPGKSLILDNKARAPYPGGAPPRGSTVGQVLKLNVVPCASLCGPQDPSFDPAQTPAIRAAGQTIPRLTAPLAGALGSGVVVQQKRQLTLNEVMGMPLKGAIDPVTGLPVNYAGGPLEILVNNTRWSGDNMMAPRPYGDFTPVQTSPMETLVSELPREGDTELWEIINLTADAHPIHLHLVQFQVMNRQGFDLKKYTAAYDSAFPGVAGNAMCGLGVYCPGFGPPLDYNAPNADGAVGGNPAVTPFLKGAPNPPAAQETGWKDTLMVPPGMVTRFIVRWSPTSAPIGATGAAAAYPFDPSGTEDGIAKYGYVWHCHIIDHEDNEMMRPDYVTPLDDVPRSFVKGEDY